MGQKKIESKMEDKITREEEGEEEEVFTKIER